MKQIKFSIPVRKIFDVNVKSQVSQKGECQRLEKSVGQVVSVASFENKVDDHRCVIVCS
jgi:hypothetical protein